MAQDQWAHHVSGDPEFAEHHAECDQGEGAKAVDGDQEADQFLSEEIEIRARQRRPPQESRVRFLHGAGSPFLHLAQIRSSLRRGQRAIVCPFSRPSSPTLGSTWKTANWD